MAIDVEIRYVNTKEEKTTGIPHYTSIRINGHAQNIGVQAGQPVEYHECICASVSTLCIALATKLKGSIEDFNGCGCVLKKGLFHYCTLSKKFSLERDSAIDVLVWGLWWLYRNYEPYFGKFDIIKGD